MGFFLGGLVVHGGVQGWWIGPVLGKLNEIPLMLGVTILTAFNDNAAITFLSTLVPGFTDSLKYAVLAGAVAGGGLTVIANAPNPAGQSLLKKHFDNAVSPVGLLNGALALTVIVWLFYGISLILLRSSKPCLYSHRPRPITRASSGANLICRFGVILPSTALSETENERGQHKSRAGDNQCHDRAYFDEVPKCITTRSPNHKVCLISRGGDEGAGSGDHKSHRKRHEADI